MDDLKPNELTQAKKLIEDGRKDEALGIVRKFQQTAWAYFNRRKSREFSFLS